MRMVMACALMALAGAGSGTGVAAATPTVQCAPQGGYQISLYGDLTCADAYDIAARYDVAGEMYQEIDPFTCYAAPSDVRPIIFQCALGDNDFAVSLA
jgi:hypothetical protein